MAFPKKAYLISTCCKCMQIAHRRVNKYRLLRLLWIYLLLTSQFTHLTQKNATSRGVNKDVILAKTAAIHVGKIIGRLKPRSGQPK
jgi:hypothetical protein